MYASNEELLRESECRWPDCVEPAGHAGPHSKGALVPESTLNWQDKLKPEELKALKIHDSMPGSVHACPAWILRSLAASRALAEARTKVMGPLRPVIANAAEYYTDDYWSERLSVGHFFGAITLGDVRAMITALALTEADFMEGSD